MLATNNHWMGRDPPVVTRALLRGPATSLLDGITAMGRQTVLVVLTALTLSACATSPPPIGRGLPAASAEARPVFDKRVKERFPVGSDEGSLLAELNREAFTVTAARDPMRRYRFSATYEVHHLACNLSWTIWWNAEKSTITDIAGDYGATCL